MFCNYGVAAATGAWCITEVRRNTAVALCCLGLSILFATGVKADTIVYGSLPNGEFGTLDINTGAFDELGVSASGLAGLAEYGGTLYGANFSSGILYSVNPANGALTAIGSPSGIAYEDFGGTTSGLFAISSGNVLYSINATTGAATPIGSGTGLTVAGWNSLSDGSSTLYYADGPDLYTVNTTTGSALLVGAFGGSSLMSGMVWEGGVLYGSDAGISGNPVDQINTSSGLATVGASASNTFYGLAPDTTSTTPEPATWTLLTAALAALLLRRRAA